MSDIENIISFQGEVQLLGWAETNSRGRTITLQLDASSPGHPFSEARTTQGRRSGQRYAIVMVEIGDDEKPVEKTYSQQAWLLCRDEQFQHFLNERSFVEVTDEASAKACVLEGCGITSRGELDTSPYARGAWLQQFHTPFQEYKSTIGKRNVL